MKIRIGQGYDVHRLVEDRPLILGGVKIPWELGLAGHSDADVVAHAVIDAVLGALALGDIGQWFPDDNSDYEGGDSIEFLRKVLAAPELSDWQLGNIDLTIIAQQPKLFPYVQEMRKNLADVFNCETDDVSVKATTTENLGFCGRGEGIAAMAVVLLERMEEAD